MKIPPNTNSSVFFAMLATRALFQSLAWQRRAAKLDPKNFPVAHAMARRFMRDSAMDWREYTRLALA